jgi:hypothetical protein
VAGGKEATVTYLPKCDECGRLLSMDAEMARRSGDPASLCDRCGAEFAETPAPKPPEDCDDRWMTAIVLGVFALVASLIFALSYNLSYFAGSPR